MGQRRALTICAATRVLLRARCLEARHAAMPLHIGARIRVFAQKLQAELVGEEQRCPLTIGALAQLHAAAVASLVHV